MLILNSLFPVCGLILLGVLFKQRGMTDSTFLQQCDRLVYYVFFPAMLFWKIGGASFGTGVDWTFCTVTLLVVFTVFVLATLIIRFLPVGDFQAGTFSQSCYRFNTYIGVAVVLNSLGEEGVALFGILIGIAIPIINVLAVSTLIWFSGETSDKRKRAELLIKALAGNPLILGCLAGIGYSRVVGTFPIFIDNLLSLLSMLTLPLALLSVGGSLTFTGVRKHMRDALFATGVKLLVLPAIGYAAYSLAGVRGMPLQVGMIFFCLPTSTAMYVLSSQMNSDTELASSTILLTTLLSFVSLSVALLL